MADQQDGDDRLPGLRSAAANLVARTSKAANQDRAGNVKVHFTGRLRARKLRPGHYLVALTPNLNGTTGRTIQLAFRIVK
jgi:hypothetical protein